MDEVRSVLNDLLDKVDVNISKLTKINIEVDKTFKPNRERLF